MAAHAAQLYGNSNGDNSSARKLRVHLTRPVDACWPAMFPWPGGRTMLLWPAGGGQSAARESLL